MSPGAIAIDRCITTFVENAVHRQDVSITGVMFSSLYIAE